MSSRCLYSSRLSILENLSSNSSRFRQYISRASPHYLQNLSKPSRIYGRGFSSTATNATSSSSDSPIRISQALGALLVFGIGTTTWGLYEFYMTLTMWPQEVRGDLRAGLRAKQRGDLKLSQKHLARAWNTIQTMPPEALSPNPYMKYSGVAVVLAEVLESDNQLDEAFAVLQTTLLLFIDSREPAPSTDSFPPQQLNSSSENSTSSSSSSSTLSNTYPRRVSLGNVLDSFRHNTFSMSQNDTKACMRAIALALKLGDMAETLNRPEDEERWLEFAVAEVLRIVRDEYDLAHDTRRGFVQLGSKQPNVPNKTQKRVENQGVQAQQSSQEEHAPDTIVRDILSPDSEDGELGLPAWVSLTKTELAAPMERLGAFYARHGKAGNAILLYRVASNLLVHPKYKSTAPNKRTSTSSPSITELCQALQIENAHMALLMNLRRANPDDAAIQHDLPRVLTRAVNMYDEAVRKHGLAHTRDDGVAVDTEISLCDETYPAVLYNAGIYYEEEGDLEQALRSYSLSYMALRTHGPRELMQEALESCRRLQRIVDKNAKRASQEAVPLGPSKTPNDSLKHSR